FALQNAPKITCPACGGEFLLLAGEGVCACPECEAELEIAFQFADEQIIGCEVKLKVVAPVAPEEDAALFAYIDKMEEGREALARIDAYFDDNGETDPAHVNWGHVGSLTYLVGLLTQVKDMIDHTGEYAG
ncbi:MAG TPA: hypothetical protein PK530_22830, partial [Anaerolineales bacterium]|nr:hypothetical protein [Anaerolineales bacterium]